ncbi:hypothetical protein [Legionella gresilensis]|uniref:hypothetical protein n=1 Tax=Legionella gresilensis TaxID=91823 RepID=UPI0013EFAA2B|nr:hypothetical protein [Legionella gresilensis]
MMPQTSYPEKKYTITGGGIAGYVIALLIHLDAQKKGERVRITINDQLSNLEDTPAANLFFSLTHVEIKAVLPPPNELLEAFNKSFDQGGIRVEVDGVNDSQVTQEFLEAVAKLEKEPVKKALEREDTLSEMGKMSMGMWDMLANFNPKLKTIFANASYHPCRNPQDVSNLFNQGYRADVMFDMEPGVAHKTVEEMCNTFKQDGYTYTKPLSPDELEAYVPGFIDFCKENSELNTQGQRVWKNSAAAILRPGGSINAAKFLRGLKDYLNEEMGTYINSQGKEQPCFQAHYDRNVTALLRDEEKAINGLVWQNQQKQQRVRPDNERHQYSKVSHFFCPGGNVATLPALGLPVPASIGFAGASFLFGIQDLPDELLQKYNNIDFGGEMHSTGVVLAVQARADGKSMSIGAAGTKSLYGDIMPDPEGVFARNRNLLQLNAINKVFPDLLSYVLKKNTKGQTLTFDDLDSLKTSQHVKTRALVRAVAYDGFTAQGQVAPNAYIMTDGGSGTASCAPAMAATILSRIGILPLPVDKDKNDKIMELANPLRTL